MENTDLRNTTPQDENPGNAIPEGENQQIIIPQDESQQNTTPESESLPIIIPEDESLKIEEEIELVSASIGKRFANYILDSIFYLIFCYLLGILIGIFVLIVSPDSLSYFEEEHKLLDYLFAFIAGILFYTLQESLSGRTLAKYITRTKVVNLSGEKPDLKSIFIRSLCRYIPFEAFSFFRTEGYGWHDEISKTRVVDVPRKYVESDL